MTLTRASHVTAESAVNPMPRPALMIGPPGGGPACHGATVHFKASRVQPWDRSFGAAARPLSPTARPPAAPSQCMINATRLALGHGLRELRSSPQGPLASPERILTVTDGRLGPCTVPAAAARPAARNLAVTASDRPTG